LTETPPFRPFADLLRDHARRQPDDPALTDADGTIDWATLDQRIDRIAARLQAEGVGKGDAVAMLGRNSIPHALVFCAALRIGAVAAPLTASATPQAISAMLRDCGASHLFADSDAIAALPADIRESGPRITAMDDAAMTGWMEDDRAAPSPVAIAPWDPFNIIYSSGTTGTPKGIVQSHAMRHGHVARAARFGYDESAVTLISTPLYSNTTLVCFLPALAGGGHVVMMPKFDARRFLELSQRHRVTHAALVPVQYQRLMDLPDFDRFDLSSYRFKSSTSAPFPPALMADVLARWPGALTNIYGMTEGGGTCILQAHEYPDKLHTVGRPVEGHDIRLIGEDGREVAAGEAGEVVGHSGAMMTGYLGQPGKTREAEWHDDQGRRFIRHGDIGRFDEDGFLMLIDRAKDMIISGGFNIYPSDLEAVLIAQTSVREAAVVGVSSAQWGETPVAFAVLREGADAQALLAAVNGKLGKTQRLHDIVPVDALPRSAIGKVLKRELRDRYGPARG